MKIATIGDIHGETFWKKINPDEFDKIIFIGDYVDSFYHTVSSMANNLADIVAFAKGYPKKVELLIGNHDIQYFKGIDLSLTQCSGFNASGLYTYTALFEANRSLFKIAYRHDKYLWTHAGVHRGWYSEFLRVAPKSFHRVHEKFPQEIDEQLNGALLVGEKSILDCGQDRGGRYPVGGPLWAGKTSIHRKGLKKYYQIIGHTHVDQIKVYKDCAFVDNMKQEFFILDI